ncbi:glycogen/starch/alpha-glucan phosphorylase [Thermocoleostomius sinensis]|uniref:Alpha-1,4 glucan phosphorylase n=1 Tax=Thermocoleostomius sinensis A174 TaxID=2016057 RepID=A0A9E9CA44_9CYAN|nr:glycogen/starch/alpha-glucan phosphorylase [Thermocoleostomius sinensis]WAL60482.1 glycogen/starch/alpha-glucan phosphorylase [Thermocoleostomius sinensis A174]
MQTQQNQSRIEDDRTSVSVEALKRSLMNHLFYLRGKLPETATSHDYYIALIYTVRDRLLSGWMATTQTYTQPHIKRLVYLSSGLLTRTALETYLINLDIQEQICQAIDELGLSLEDLLKHDVILDQGKELEASSYLLTHYFDALTSLAFPAIGYGIRYEVETEPMIECQMDRQGTRLYCSGNPWEISRPEQLVEVKVGGHTESRIDEQGRFCVQWVPERVIRGLPYDTPISGYRTNTVNTVRLWAALGTESVDLGARSERLTLDRLQQHYFLMACSLQDMLRMHCIERKQPIETLPNAFTVQLDGAAQAIAIVELMRLLLDEYRLDWDTAWRITQNTFTYSYDPSTLEEIRDWNQLILQQQLPRHLELIYEINQRFLADIRQQFSVNDECIRRLSLIDDDDTVRLPHLAVLGSYATTGAITIRTHQAFHEGLAELQALFPDRFKDQDDRSICHRSLLALNPQLSQLITRNLGKRWIRQCQALHQLEALMDSTDFCQAWRSIKQAHKHAVADWVQQATQVSINPQALLDVQIQPIGESQRQLLSVFYIITLYNRLKLNPTLDITPRTFVFNSTRQSSNIMATLTAQLIESVAQVINHDRDLRDQLKVVCLKSPLAVMKTLYVATDLIEQIAIATTDEIDLSHLSLGLNGALTIGTLNATSLLLQRQVGEGNFFLFGLTADEVVALQSSGYDPWHFYQNHRELQRVIDRIAMGDFTDPQSNSFKPLIDAILEQDHDLLLADYPFYVDCQDQIAAIYADEDWWTRLSILNAARIGQTSCDRIIQANSQALWNIEPVAIPSLGVRQA